MIKQPAVLVCQAGNLLRIKNGPFFDQGKMYAKIQCRRRLAQTNGMIEGVTTGNDRG